MKTLDDLLALRGAGLSDAARALDADPAQREAVTGYQGLADLDAIDAPDGARLFARADSLVLIYVGPDALPAEVDDAALRAAIGAEPPELRSRQGKRATLHVAAEQGIAWSEQDGDVGFVEIFPATTLESYRQRIYLEPPRFAQ